MAYPAILDHRMPYDIDGTAVGIRMRSSSAFFSNGVQTWLSAAQTGGLNREDRSATFEVAGYSLPGGFWFFFPELREVTNIGFLFSLSSQMPPAVYIQGSDDTTNGMDGTWETAVFTASVSRDADQWRKGIFAVSLSKAIKTLRVGFSGTRTPAASAVSLNAIHIYGRAAAGARPDNLYVADASGNEMHALMDFGDQPEGSTEIRSFKIKNQSPSKIANDVNVQLNHEDYAMAWSPDGPWLSVLDIASIGPESVSSTIYVRNKLGPPLLALGPKAARAIIAVGSWS